MTRVSYRLTLYWLEDRPAWKIKRMPTTQLVSVAVWRFQAIYYYGPDMRRKRA